MDAKRLIEEVSKASKEKAEEVRRRLMDIVSLRLLKLFSYAAKRIKPATIDRMTPEENILFELVMGLVNEWMSHVCPKGGEEV
jgi:DNA replication initiation complex subunit (GINS family)